MAVIEALRVKHARDAWELQMRGQMIDIVRESVERLQLAGFAPTSDLDDSAALVTLRIDARAWALPGLRDCGNAPQAVAA